LAPTRDDLRRAARSCIWAGARSAKSRLRRRRRHHLRIGAYPITVILAAAALSLAGQLAQAKASITGWLLAAVPAIGFLALTKLVISRPTPPTPTPQAQVRPASMPVQATLHRASASTVEPHADDLIPGARIVADAFHRATGHHIDRDTLADRLQVPLSTAQRLLDALRATAPTRTTAAVPARFTGEPAVDALT
jgi:hypothetical protein